MYEATCNAINKNNVIVRKVVVIKSAISVLFLMRTMCRLSLRIVLLLLGICAVRELIQ